MNVLKEKTVFLIIALITGISGTAAASGDVDVDLACYSPSLTIRMYLGHNGYYGSAGRYGRPTSSDYGSYDSDGNYTQEYRLVEDRYVDVAYRDTTPYVLRDDVFRANPNYYRTGMSGSGSEGWWIFGDSDSADFPARQYHQYATPTSSKDSAVTGTSYGQIKLTYKRHDGTSGEKVINVQIQNRECESYNNGKWREVSPGRWEQR
jgi:hypothetical protein